MYGLWNIRSKSWVRICKDDMLCCGFFDSLEELISVYAGKDVSLQEFKEFHKGRLVIVKANITAHVKDIV